MVIISRSVPNPRVIPAYLTVALSTDALDKIRAAFAFGSQARFRNPLSELCIHDDPSYYNQSAEDVRRSVNSAGMKEPFVLIDAATPLDGTVWYVMQFATQVDVDENRAARTDVLWKIKVKIESVDSMACNYDIGNMSITEDLENCGAEFPCDPSAHPQKEPFDLGREYFERGSASLQAYIVALPGEWEETTDAELMKKILPPKFLARSTADAELMKKIRPPPKSLVRLTAEAAKQSGLKPRWTWFWKNEKTFEEVGAPKEGSARFVQYYDEESPLWK